MDYTGIMRKRVTGKHLALAAQGMSPNKIYTFDEHAEPLLRLANAARAYIQEEEIAPSMLRLHPEIYDKVIPFLIPEKKHNPRFFYYLDGEFPILVAPVILSERRLDRHEVECVGRQRTGPQLPVLVTGDSVVKDIA